MEKLATHKISVDIRIFLQRTLPVSADAAAELMTDLLRASNKNPDEEEQDRMTVLSAHQAE